MRIEATDLPGVFVVDVEPLEDERGWFARTFDAGALADAGLDPTVVQCSISSNTAAGTLRGMHFQQGPHGESKLIRCTRGRIFDVLVDARAGAPTFGRWISVDLAAEGYRAVFVSPGIAHGFVTLEPHSEVFYQMSVAHRPAAACGFRWDDPAVGIEWPREPVVMSERDRALPPLHEVPYRQEARP
jgi:dTDP-4-dehydrorhamnose 3,5-epimerase